MEEINGNSLFYLKKFIIKKYNREVWQKIIEETDETTKTALSKPILSNNFYTRTLYQQLLGALEDVSSREDVMESAEYQAKKQLGGIFSFFVRFMDPEKILARITEMWAKMWTGGIMSLEDNTQDSYKLLLKNFEMTEPHRVHMEIYLKTMLEYVTKACLNGSYRAIDGRTTEFYFHKSVPETTEEQQQ